jgi:hypothetical protein
MHWFSPTNIIWVAVHLLLLLLGLLILHGDFLPLRRELTEGIGISLFATGVAGEILFLYVASTDSMRTRLELITQAGLVNVFPHRSVRMRDEYEARISKAKEIDLLGFGLSSFREDFHNKFAELADQAVVRILVLDPDFPNSRTSVASIRDREERNQVGRIRSEVEKFEEVVRQIPGLDRSRFQLKRLRALPSVNIFRIDGEIFWGPYLVGQQSRNMPTLLVRQGGFLYAQLKQHFEELWNNDEFSASVK